MGGMDGWREGGRKRREGGMDGGMDGGREGRREGIMNTKKTYSNKPGLLQPACCRGHTHQFFDTRSWEVLSSFILALRPARGLSLPLSSSPPDSSSLMSANRKGRGGEMEDGGGGGEVRGREERGGEGREEREGRREGEKKMREQIEGMWSRQNREISEDRVKGVGGR